MKGLQNNWRLRKGNKKEANKRMPVWMLILTDLLLTLICLGIFTLYHLVLPRQLSDQAIVVATTSEDKEQFELPSSENTGNMQENTSNMQENTGKMQENTGKMQEYTGKMQENTSNMQENTGKMQENIGKMQANTGSHEGSGKDNAAKDNNDSNLDHQNNNTLEETMNTGPLETGIQEEVIEITNYGNRDTVTIQGDVSERDFINSSDMVITKVNQYSSDQVEFTTNKVELGSGRNKITYYISDIYVANVKYIKTAFADGLYGKNLKEPTLQMAMDNDALLAINGDYYGNNEIGVVIRNGILYRTEIYDADLCVLFTDGTMKTYAPEEFDMEEILQEGAWQAWIFGPELLDGDGNVLSSFNSTYYLNKEHPRTAIGYVEQGHYVFVVVDGRNPGYSRGVTLSELGQIMANAGCSSAYNLDGGKSSAMVYGDSHVNQPYEGGRSISDIIYIGE